MTHDVKPIHSDTDHERALAEVERLWGAKSHTPEGDRLDVLATLIDAYEAEHHPIDPPAVFAASPSRRVPVSPQASRSRTRSMRPTSIGLPCLSRMRFGP